MSVKLLPHLEYCNIDQAAELLGCKTENILQWGASGLIGGSILLSGESGLLNFYSGNNKLDDDNTIREELMELLGSNKPEDESRKIAILGRYAELTEDLFPAFIDDSKTVLASGLWTFEPRFFTDLARGKQGLKLDGELVPAGHDREGEYASFELWSMETPGRQYLSTSQVVIIKRDLERLKRSIALGKPLNKISHSSTLEQESESRETERGLTTKQKEFMRTLMRLVPELRGELPGRDATADAIDRALGKQRLPPLNVSGKQIFSWLGEYSKE